MRSRIQLAFAAAAAASVIAACSDRSSVAVAELKTIAAKQSSRYIESRLSVTDEYLPAAEARSTPVIPVALRAAALKVLRDAEPTTSEGVRGRAAAYLLTGNHPAAIDELRRVGSGDPLVMSDLAGAFLVEAATTNRMELLVEAVASADAALALRPDLAPAAFNRALALQRLGLLAPAHEEWLRLGGLERSPAWRAEAQKAARMMSANNERDGWKSASARLQNDQLVGERAKIAASRYPQQARTWGESIYLSQWADGSADALNVARALGDALHSFNGESLLRDSVRIIDRGENNSGKRSQIAAAHRLYRDGRIAFRDHRLGEAESLLRRAEEAFTRVGSPMRLSARYYRAAVLHEGSRIDEAERLLDELAGLMPERTGYRALSAQIGWERGMCKLLRGELTEARRIFLSSHAMANALHERDLTATFHLLLAQHAEYGGDSGEAWQHRARAFAALSGTGNSYRVTVALLAAAATRVRSDDWRRAEALAGIAAAMAVKLKEPLLISQALLFASRAAAEQNRPQLAAERLTAADRWITRVTDTKQRDRLNAERALAAGASKRDRAPLASIGEFSRAIEFYERSGHTVLVPRPYLERARAHRRAGNAEAARADLEAGISLVERHRGLIQDLEQRAAYLSVAEGLFTEAADLAIDRNDADDAVFALERGRARAILDAFNVTGLATRVLSAGELQTALAPTAAIVILAQVKKRTVVILIRPRTLTLLRDAGDRPALLDKLQQQLNGVSALVIVGDSRLDRSLKKSLIAKALGEKFVVESPSATAAVQSSLSQDEGAGERPLVVAASLFETSPKVVADPLRHVDAEGRAVRDIWPHSRLLNAGGATRDAVLKEVQSATSFHFAGHGIHQADHPAEARLLLAPKAGERPFITASEIARLRLPETRLVILNACRSGAPGNRADGVMNLATAFHFAGVRDVVAAAEDVDDATAAEFAVQFHRHLRAGLSAGEAFRATMAEARARLGGDQAVERYGGFMFIGGISQLVRRDFAVAQKGTRQ